MIFVLVYPSFRYSRVWLWRVDFSCDITANRRTNRASRAHTSLSSKWRVCCCADAPLGYLCCCCCCVLSLYVLYPANPRAPPPRPRTGGVPGCAWNDLASQRQSSRERLEAVPRLHVTYKNPHPCHACRIYIRMSVHTYTPYFVESNALMLRGSIM